MNISLAPLQGYTEFPFRNTLANFIGGIDKFYTPFLRFDNDGSLRSKHLNDLKPENNREINLIPQILVNNAGNFLSLAKRVEDAGYSEVNWNLGCPYPMVAKRKLGSGLLAFPELIDSILDEVYTKTKLSISIKLRSGYDNDQEIFKVIDILNSYPIKEVIYHPRIGKQLYKGTANFNQFLKIKESCKLPLAYNGDVDTVVKFKEIVQTVGSINHIMIGRGLIANPFLVQEIKGVKFTESKKREIFSSFYHELSNHYKNALSGDSHLLNKMIHFWEYFSHLYIEQRKVYKMLKKSNNLQIFEDKAEEIIQKFELK